jgi:hypothetical protein
MKTYFEPATVGYDVTEYAQCCGHLDLESWKGFRLGVFIFGTCCLRGGGRFSENYGEWMVATSYDSSNVTMPACMAVKGQRIRNPYEYDDLP